MEQQTTMSLDSDVRRLNDIIASLYEKLNEKQETIQ
jgi:hypothetical protein